MKNKPVKPALHGIIDYLFSGIQLIVPYALGINKKTVRTYAILGTGFLTVNALTATPVGLKRAVTFKGHQKADGAFLTGLALLTCTSFIRKDKRALAFHLAFLSTAIAHYALTDYDAATEAANQ